MKSDVCSIALNNRILENIEDFNTLEEAALELARLILVSLIQQLDEQLLESAPKGWRCIGKRSRTLSTRVGDIEITRRLYRKATKKGKQCRFLLDEALNIRKRRRVTHGLLKLMVAMATRLPFREVSMVLKEAGLPEISHTTVHQEVRYYGDLQRKRLEQERRALFATGQDITKGKQRKALPILFLEADGISVSSQRCNKRSLEIKVGIAYEGWHEAGRSRKLKNPHVLMGVLEGGEAFWETFSADLATRYDLQDTQVVINGDGASWIQKTSREYFDGAIIQLDRFHIRRDLRLVFGSEIAAKLYEKLREGETEVFIDTLEAMEPEVPAAKRQIYDKLVSLSHNYPEHLADYRCRIGQEHREIRLHGMGVAETMVDKKIANRMKKRGMSWSRAGAYAMATLLMLRSNGQLFKWLDDNGIQDIVNPAKKLRHLAKEAPTTGPGVWMQASVPMLGTATTPCARALRELSRPVSA